jgi:hypothetical protein
MNAARVYNTCISQPENQPDDWFIRLGMSLPTGDPDPNPRVFNFLEAILGSVTFSATG